MGSGSNPAGTLPITGGKSGLRSDPIELGSDNDFFTNTGTLSGSLFLSGGDDTFIGGLNV